MIGWPSATAQPAPLYLLLLLATLLSARIPGSVAVNAARELFAAGMRTLAAMAHAEWQHRVDALGRGHSRRYEERTATQLGDGAHLLRDRWAGDLRRLHDEARGDVARLHRRLQEFPGIGPVGADMFLREAQAVWPDVRALPGRSRARGCARPHVSGRRRPEGAVRVRSRAV